MEMMTKVIMVDLITNITGTMNTNLSTTIII